MFIRVGTGKYLSDGYFYYISLKVNGTPLTLLAPSAFSPPSSAELSCADSL